MTSTRILLATVGIAALTACGSPRHLQYDHGRAFTEALTAQTDLTRPSAANATPGISGNEAEAIRLRAVESATDEESGESELQATK